MRRRPKQQALRFWRWARYWPFPLVGVFLGVAGGALAGTDADRQVVETLTAEETGTLDIRYYLYTPEGYESDPDKEWPVVFFLHGVGKLAKNGKFTQLGRDSINTMIHNQERRESLGFPANKIPFFLVTPEATEWWTNAPQWTALIALRDRIVTEKRIDPKRIYLTGQSMGGFATWKMATGFSDKFTAYAPLCGKPVNSTSTYHANQMKDLPIWIFHGLKDKTVTPDEDLAFYELLVAAGADKVQLTTYPNLAHNIWDTVYALPEFYAWLLSWGKEEKSYARWAAAWEQSLGEIGTLQDPDGDRDGDQLSNFEEYAHQASGTSPAAVDKRPIQAYVENGRAMLQYAVDLSLPDVALTAEASQDLSRWYTTSDALKPEGFMLTERSLSGDLLTYGASLPIDTASPEAGGVAFLRLKVESVP